MYQSSLLKDVPHAFFTRRGGVSQPPYDTLSFVVNKKDSVDNVRRNRELALEKLGLPLRQLVTMNQVHGTDVVVVEQPWGFNQGNTPDADALITQNPDVVLGVFTADCVPVMLYDKPSQTIAVVHSGWRGALRNVVGVTLNRMQQLGVNLSSVCAVVGPCIAQADYEVGAEVYESFMDTSAVHGRFFRPSHNNGKYMFDLPGVVLQQLSDAEIMGVEFMDLNTYKMEHDFFSCRRSFHRGEKEFGCMLSAIGLNS